MLRRHQTPSVTHQTHSCVKLVDTRGEFVTGDQRRRYWCIQSRTRQNGPMGGIRSLPAALLLVAAAQRFHRRASVLRNASWERDDSQLVSTNIQRRREACWDVCLGATLFYFRSLYIMLCLLCCVVGCYLGQVSLPKRF